MVKQGKIEFRNVQFSYDELITPKTDKSQQQQQQQNEQSSKKIHQHRPSNIETLSSVQLSLFLFHFYYFLKNQFNFRSTKSNDNCFSRVFYYYLFL